jgi:hypothetical protein
MARACPGNAPTRATSATRTPASANRAPAGRASDASTAPANRNAPGVRCASRGNASRPVRRAWTASARRAFPRHALPATSATATSASCAQTPRIPAPAAPASPTTPRRASARAARGIGNAPMDVARKSTTAARDAACRWASIAARSARTHARSGTAITSAAMASAATAAASSPASPAATTTAARRRVDRTAAPPGRTAAKGDASMSSATGTTAAGVG